MEETSNTVLKSNVLHPSLLHVENILPSAKANNYTNRTTLGTARNLEYNVKNIYYRNTAWVICEAIHLTCIAIAVYLLYALLHYRAIKANYKKRSIRHRRGGEWLEKLCIIGIIAALLRFANNQALLFTGWRSSTHCATLLNLSIALYFLTLHPVYLFLWIRQRIFYSNRALKHLYGKTVRFLSWAAIVCFTGVTIVSMVLFVVDPQNNASGRVCRYSKKQNNTFEITSQSSFDHSELSDDQKEQGVIVNMISGIVAGVIQTSFLALFLYPMMDNKMKAMRSQHMQGGNTVLITLIKRSFALAGVCILSDICIALVFTPLHTHFPDAIFAPLAMYDLNLIINLLCIIMTFRRWRVMLFPWFYTGCSLLPCCKSCATVVTRKSSGKYRVNAPKPPVCAILSLETATQGEKSNLSNVRNPKIPSRRFTKKVMPQDPVPDVILPILDTTPTHRSEKWIRESLATDYNENIQSDIYQHSDTVLYTTFHATYLKRSSSLVINSNTITGSPRKRTKSNLTQTLLNKPKIWLKDGKASFSSCSSC